MIEATTHIPAVHRLVELYPGLVREETAAVLGLTLARLEGEAVKRAPKGVSAAGGYAGSIFGEVHAFGESVSGVMGTPCVYAEVIEFGREKEKFPPIDPLIHWARRVLGLGDEEAVKALNQ